MDVSFKISENIGNKFFKVRIKQFIHLHKKYPINIISYHDKVYDLLTVHNIYKIISNLYQLV